MKYILLFALTLAPAYAAAQDNSADTQPAATDSSAAAAAPATPSAADAQAAKLDELEKRVYALETAPAPATQASFNPAMGAALDFDAQQSNGRAAFNFRAAEVNVESPIDPYAKGWAVLTGAPNGVTIEEAGVETTSLPDNLTVRGGRIFASFGRLGHVHDHELPVADRPNSLENFVGGESQSDGAEVSWLLPTDAYVNATFGAYDKIGEDNTRLDPTQLHKPGDMTYLGRMSTYRDLTDNASVEVGGSFAWTPEMNLDDDNGNTLTTTDTGRRLAGIDVTYRYQPPSGGLNHGLLWGSELFYNSERRVMADDASTSRVDAYAGYSYIQMKFGPVWYGGVMADITEDLTNNNKVTQTYSAFLSHDISEFQRLRGIYSIAHANDGSNNVNSFEIQWTAVMGHHVHGFKDR